MARFDKAVAWTLPDWRPWVAIPGCHAHPAISAALQDALRNRILKTAFTKRFQVTGDLASGFKAGGLWLVMSIQSREAIMRSLFLAAIAAVAVTASTSFVSSDAEARCFRCVGPRVAPVARVGVVAPRARVGVVAPRRVVVR